MAKVLTDPEKAAICARYVQTNSLRGVASEFGVSPMRVKRVWESVSKTDQMKCRGAVAVERKVIEVQVIEGEGDYIKKLVRARNAAIEELYTRLTDENKRGYFSDKNLIAACKTLHDIVCGAEQSPKEPNNVFTMLSNQLNNEINNFYINENGTKANDNPDSGSE